MVSWRQKTNRILNDILLKKKDKRSKERLVWDRVDGSDGWRWFNVGWRKSVGGWYTWLVGVR